MLLFVSLVGFVVLVVLVLLVFVFVAAFLGFF